MSVDLENLHKELSGFQVFFRTLVYFHKQINVVVFQLIGLESYLDRVHSLQSAALHFSNLMAAGAG